MNIQHVIVVITQTVLQAFFLKKDSPSPISIEGNTSIKYQSDDDFKMLVDSIKDTFNIDEFSDIPLSVIVINANADSVNADKLFKNFEKAEQHSLIRAENIIPYILACKGKLNKDESFNISLFDASYSIKSNDEKIECLPEKIDSQKNIEITAADFLTLFKVNPSAIGVDEGEISGLKDKIETLQQSVASKEKEIQEITEEKNKLQLTSDNLEKELKETKKQSEIEKIQNSIIPAFLSFDSNSYKILGDNVDDLSREPCFKFIFEPLCHSGDFVIKSQKIAKVTTFIFYKKGDRIEYETSEVISLRNGYIYFNNEVNKDLKCYYPQKKQSVTQSGLFFYERSKVGVFCYGQPLCAFSNCVLKEKIDWMELSKKIQSIISIKLHAQDLSN